MRSDLGTKFEIEDGGKNLKFGSIVCKHCSYRKVKMTVHSNGDIIVRCMLCCESEYIKSGYTNMDIWGVE